MVGKVPSMKEGVPFCEGADTLHEDAVVVYEHEDTTE